jgi:transcription initiation factor TFIIB
MPSKSSVHGSLEKCPECLSNNVFHDFERGEIKCHDCGAVLTDHVIDPGQDWRAYDKQEESKKARCGPPTSPHVSGSTFSYPATFLSRDAKGKQLTPTQNGYTTRLRRAHINNTFTNADRLYKESLRILALMNTKLQLSDELTRSVTSTIQRAINERRFKLTLAPLVAACIYVTCKINCTPRTFEELAASMPTGAPKQNRRQIWIFFNKLFDNRLLLHESYSTRANTKDDECSGVSGQNGGKVIRLLVSGGKSQLYVPRFCSELGLSVAVAVNAIRRLLALESMNMNIELFGRNPNPVSIAAAAIYESSRSLKQPRSEEQISRVTGISEMTIRKHVKALLASQTSDLSASS